MLRLCLAALTAGLAAAADKDDALWVAPPSVGRPEQATDALRGLDMRCIKGSPDLSACLVKDLYYDLVDGNFLFFGRNIDVEAGRDTDADVERRFEDRTCVHLAVRATHGRPTRRVTFSRSIVAVSATIVLTLACQPWPCGVILRRRHAPYPDKAWCMCRSFLKEAQNRGGFGFRWSGAAPPSAAHTCRVAVPVHLRQEWPLGAPDLGTLLRDNFQPLVTIAMKFGLSASHFSWVSWPRASGPGTDALSHMQQKYAHWLSVHDTYKWDGLVAACREGALGISAPRLPHSTWTRASRPHSTCMPERSRAAQLATSPAGAKASSLCVWRARW